MKVLEIAERLEQSENAPPEAIAQLKNAAQIGKNNSVIVYGKQRDFNRIGMKNLAIFLGMKVLEHEYNPNAVLEELPAERILFCTTKPSIMAISLRDVIACMRKRKVEHVISRCGHGFSMKADRLLYCECEMPAAEILEVDYTPKTGIQILDCTPKTGIQIQCKRKGST